MAKFGVRNINKVRTSVEKKINRAIRDTKVLQDIADDLIKDIKSGVSPKTGKPFTRLSPKTVEHRKYIARYNKTGKGYSASKSNLTLTGQLIESIKAKILVTKSQVIIEPTGTRKKYKGKSGRPIGKKAPPTNKKLAQIHAEGGPNLPKRDILTFSKKRVKEITKKIRKAVLRRF